MGGGGQVVAMWFDLSVNLLGKKNQQHNFEI